MLNRFPLERVRHGGSPVAVPYALGSMALSDVDSTLQPCRAARVRDRTSARKRGLVAGACFTALVLAACGGDDATRPSIAAAFPGMFALTGTAEGMHGEFSIECALDLRFEVIQGDREASSGLLIAQGGGEALRTVLDPEGAGIGLRPDLYSPAAEVHLLPGDSVEFVTPLNQDTGVPFYDSLAVMRGHRTASGAEGTWSCGPFLTRDDTAGVVTGPWEIRPAS